MSSPSNPPGPVAAFPHGRHPRLAALLLLTQFVCMWIAFFILMPAIDWPASLDQPPSVVLPLIAQEAGPVFAGYTFYLMHALLLVPLAIVLAGTLRMTRTLGSLAVTLGVLAGLAKALGIVRWIFLMPVLAASYLDPAASVASRAAIEAITIAFNAYAGGVGELLGVGLFAGLWTVLISIALLRAGARWLGLTGLVAALGLLATLASVAGFESAILLTLSGIVWQVWTAAVAVWHLRSSREARA